MEMGLLISLLGFLFLTAFITLGITNLPNIPNISENELQQVKTKLRNICERYRNIKVQYKQRQISKSLSQREDTTIMKADKVRGVVIMNKSKYLEKCLTLLNSEQFVRLN